LRRFLELSQEFCGFFVQKAVKPSRQNFGYEFMKKYGLRIALFALSFIIGIGFLWFLKLSVFKNAPANEQSEIEIKFKEFVKTNDGTTADFEITNHGKDSYFYKGQLIENANEPVFTLTYVSLDGKKDDSFRCASGMVERELKPGETKTFRVSPDINSYWTQGKSVKIGFDFKQNLNLIGSVSIVREYQTYWSEDLPILDPTARQLLNEQKQR
jgi:hypothetical protein